MGVCLAAPALGAREKVVVLPFTGSDPSLGAAASEQLSTELARDSSKEIVSAGDLVTLIGVERQRQLLGCGDESSSCMAELTAALGAPWVVAGSLSRVGALLRVDVKLLPTNGGSAVVREGRTLANDDQLPGAITEIAGTLLAKWGFREPSRVPLVLFISGAVVGAAGIACVLVSFAQRQSLATAEQRAGVTFAEGIKLESSANALSVAGWSMLGAGVAASVAGLVLKFVDQPPTGPIVWVAPSGPGVVVGGAW